MQGEKLPKPSECHEAVYKVMKKCWKENPEDRPTFTEVVVAKPKYDEIAH